MKLALERRLELKRWDALRVSIISILVAFGIFSIILINGGVNPLDGYWVIFSFAYSPELGLWLTIQMGIFLLLVTLAFILPLKAGIWNIGAEGQFYLGGIGAFGISYMLGNIQTEILVPLALIVAGLFGAGYGAIAGLLKGKLGVNEIILTLMLNWIGYWLVNFLIVGGPWMGSAESVSIPLPNSARIPMLWNLPLTVFLGLALCVMIYFLLVKFKIGYQIRALGYNPAASTLAGMNQFKITLLVMSIGGAMAGIAAYHLWGGNPNLYVIPKSFYVHGMLTYYGIVCGLLSLLNPLAAIPTSIFFAGIIIGSPSLNRYGIKFGIDVALLGILMLVLIAFQFFYRYRLLIKK